jgi:thymidylate synthase ThyX
MMNTETGNKTCGEMTCDECNAVRERLLRELEELKAWRAGQKGIEDYYIVKEKLYVAETSADAWRKCAERLAASLRSEMRGEDARYTGTGRLCSHDDLDEFDRLKGKG